MWSSPANDHHILSVKSLTCVPFTHQIYFHQVHFPGCAHLSMPPNAHIAMNYPK
jgi:hypothetical protein